MCPVLNLQCQLTTTYFNLEFLSDVFFYIILIPLIYGFCCVFCYNRYFALGKSSDMFVYAENIYTRNLFTKSSRIFCFHDEVMHPPLPICIVPGFVQVSWCACDVSGRTGYPRKKLDLQASIFLEYLILSH